MMAFPVNTPFDLNELLPAMTNFPFQQFFQSLFFQGLALFLCNGITNTIAAILFLKKNDNLALKFALAAGIPLIAWDAYELLFLPNLVAVFYLLVGLVQVIMCIHLLNPRQEDKYQFVALTLIGYMITIR